MTSLAMRAVANHFKLMVSSVVSIHHRSPTPVNSTTLRALFTNFFTPLLTRKFCNLLDDCLESTNLTNHKADYKIRGIKNYPGIKNLVNKTLWLKT